MSTNLQKVLAEIKATLPVASEDLNEDDSTGFATLSGRRGRKRAAEERLKQLRYDYSILLRESAVFLIVVGSERDALTELLDPAFNCFKANPEELYSDIVGRINESLYGRDSTSSLFGLASRYLEEKAIDLGVTGMPLMTFKNEYDVPIKNKEDMTSLLKMVINSEVGAELAGVQAVHSVIDAAIAREHSGRTTSIVLNTGDLKLAADLDDALQRLTPRVYTIVAGKLPKGVKANPGSVTIKEINEEKVTAAMESIKASLKR